MLYIKLWYDNFFFHLMYEDFIAEKTIKILEDSC